MKCYRLSIDKNVHTPNKIYNRKGYPYKDVKLFGTINSSLEDWIDLFHKENPEIDKLYLYSFEYNPKIKTFTFQDIMYSEFIFNPKKVEFEFEREIK